MSADSLAVSNGARTPIKAGSGWLPQAPIARQQRQARQQARTACAAALLRWIHVVITRQVA